MFSLGIEGAKENMSDFGELGGNSNQLLTVAHHPRHRHKQQLETNYLSDRKLMVNRAKAAKPKLKRHPHRSPADRGGMRTGTPQLIRRSQRPTLQGQVDTGTCGPTRPLGSTTSISTLRVAGSYFWHRQTRPELCELAAVPSRRLAVPEQAAPVSFTPPCSPSSGAPF